MELILLELLRNSNNAEIIEAVNQQADMIAANREIIVAQTAAMKWLAYYCTALLIMWTATTIFAIVSNLNLRTRLKKLDYQAKRFDGNIRLLTKLSDAFADHCEHR